MNKEKRDELELLKSLSVHPGFPFFRERLKALREAELQHLVYTTQTVEEMERARGKVEAVDEIEGLFLDAISQLEEDTEQ